MKMLCVHPVGFITRQFGFRRASQSRKRFECARSSLINCVAAVLPLCLLLTLIDFRQLFTLTRISGDAKQYRTGLGHFLVF